MKQYWKNVASSLLCVVTVTLATNAISIAPPASNDVSFTSESTVAICQQENSITPLR